jgi:hypothetical protein
MIELAGFGQIWKIALRVQGKTANRIAPIPNPVRPSPVCLRAKFALDCSGQFSY